jgi:hypothetical protein
MIMLSLRNLTIKELGNVRFVGTFDQIKKQLAATIAMAEGRR